MCHACFSKDDLIGKIVLPGNPMSTQSIYGHRAVGKTVIKYIVDNAKKLKYIYSIVARRQWNTQKKPLITYKIAVVIDIYYWTLRSWDWDNMHKIAQDSLIGIVIEDDKLIYKATVNKLYDKLNPRYEFTIYKYKI